LRFAVETRAKARDYIIGTIRQSTLKDIICFHFGGKMRIAVIVMLMLFVCGTAFAQTSTVGFMHAIHATNNVDKTLTFYNGLFGLSTPPRAFPNENVPLLTNSPGVNLRLSMLAFPGNGFSFELTEFSKVERHAAQAQIWDPGAPHMKVFVRDIEPVVAAARKLGSPILTRSAAPVDVTTSSGKANAIFLRDPDGYIVEVLQIPAAADAPAGNLLGSMMGVTVADMDAGLAFWHGLLGFELIGDKNFSTDAAMLDLMGLPKGASFRTVTGVVPGSKARIEFIEFKGVKGTPFDLRVPDPGASGMAIRVTKLEDLLKRMKAQGVRVISRNGEIVNWSPGVRNVFVKDPGGINIELVESTN
jgi:catechol 2,3-dioxygenase-like lactoylglutathione lyase family enzyme